MVNLTAAQVKTVAPLTWQEREALFTRKRLTPHDPKMDVEPHGAIPDDAVIMIAGTQFLRADPLPSITEAPQYIDEDAPFVDFAAASYALWRSPNRPDDDYIGLLCGYEMTHGGGRQNLVNIFTFVIPAQEVRQSKHSFDYMKFYIKYYILPHWYKYYTPVHAEPELKAQFPKLITAWRALTKDFDYRIERFVGES